MSYFILDYRLFQTYEQNTDTSIPLYTQIVNNITNEKKKIIEIGFARIVTMKLSYVAL